MNREGKAARMHALLLVQDQAWLRGVTLNVITPGPVAGIPDLGSAIDQYLHGFAWQKRTEVSPQDIAEGVAFLCSEAGLFYYGVRPALSVPLSKEVKPMISYIIVSVISGILFGLLDGVINANSLAKKLYEVYRPIAKTSINPLIGIVIDLAFGFIMAGIFLLLYNSLPGEIGLIKGVSFAVLTWFFRVVMYVASQWVMFTVPVKTLLYTLLAGLGEMLILGIFYGLALKPAI